MQCIAKSGQAEQTINKSRFVAVAEHCATEREVTLFLTRLASAHPHAHHLAFAYQLKTAKIITQRMHDAGEPSGTAGRPILQQVEGQKLVNVCVGVIRYYGGINLGTGGLARAYGGTAKLAIETAHLIPFVEMCEIRLVLEYPRLDSFIHALEKVNGKILEKQFSERVTLIASLPSHKALDFQNRFGNE
jgi:uncharacterized YigZ family protein